MTAEELRNLKIDPPDEEMRRAAKAKLDAIAKPLDSLGRFEEIIARCGGMMRTEAPRFDKKAVIAMIADNGIVFEGVSQSGQDVTTAVAYSMGRRASSVCKMAAQAGGIVVPVDVGIANDDEIPGILNCKVMQGTKDFLIEPAMTAVQCAKAITVGIETAKWCAEDGYTMLGTGEMGIGNTTTSTAVAAALLGIEPAEIAGRGAGASDAMLARKIEVLEKGLAKYGFAPSQTNGSAPDAFEVLRCVGGLDIAGLCGVFIGGAMMHIPVVLDGVISGAAALLAERLVPGTKEYMVASHLGAEPALPKMLYELGLAPVIDAKLALGEGTGAAMFFGMMNNVMAVVDESASFDDIAVTQYERFT